MSGLILKKEANLFQVEEGGQVVVCVARKNLKKDGIFVGDRVQLDADGTIAKVLPRQNLLIRPPLANLQRMLIVIAPVPKPDLYTVDKLLVFCQRNGIVPILCINKCDLDENFCKNLQKTYKNIAKTIVFSTLDDSVQKLQKEIVGICALAGQSAVGKSSIINALTKSCVAKVDTFSKKIERGKQTTRVVRLYKFVDGYLADTAGFSKLDESLLDVEHSALWRYYPDFLTFAENCKYKTCTHTGGNDCGVVEAAKLGKIAKERFENYKKLYETLKNIKRY